MSYDVPAVLASVEPIQERLEAARAELGEITERIKAAASDGDHEAKQLIVISREAADDSA